MFLCRPLEVRLDQMCRLYCRCQSCVLSSTSTMTTVESLPDRLLVQIASYNTNLQALQGLPQDLVDWLAPTLHVSSFLTKRRAPDIVAVGFQELLPLHHGRECVPFGLVLDNISMI